VNDTFVLRANRIEDEPDITWLFLVDSCLVVQVLENKRSLKLHLKGVPPVSLIGTLCWLALSSTVARRLVAAAY